jgi:hypothetical protein
VQSKKQSVKEVLTSTSVGMVGSFLITMMCLQIFKDQLAIGISTTVLCTVWSIGRGYAIRRYYNSKVAKENLIGSNV